MNSFFINTITSRTNPKYPYHMSSQIVIVNVYDSRGSKINQLRIIRSIAYFAVFLYLNYSVIKHF